MFMTKNETLRFNFFQIKMRRLTFLLLFAYSNSLPVREQNEMLWAKLRHYQTVTGLPDDKIMAIWEKSLSINSGPKQGFYII